MKKTLTKLLSVFIAATIVLFPFAALAATEYYVDTDLVEENIYYLGREIYVYGNEDDEGDSYYSATDDDDYIYQIYYYGDDYYLYFQSVMDNENDYVYFSYSYPYVTVNVGVYSGDASTCATAHADIVVYDYDAEDVYFTVDTNPGGLSTNQINNLANINLRWALQGFAGCLYVWDSDYSLENLGFCELCDHYYSTSYIAATTSESGLKIDYCVECGLIKVSDYAPIGKISLSTSAYSYDGKTKKPSVKVLDKNGKTIASSNYSVSYQSGRKNIGRYWVKVKFKGSKYSGSKTLYFTIGPKGTSVSSLTAKSKGFTVKWKKQTSKSTGYQIQYATDSKFTKDVKTVTVSKNTTTSKTITKLKGKKKYYVRVRTYKTVSGNKCYSAWSGSKSITTKK